MYVWLGRFAIGQKVTEHCKSTTKKIFLGKKKTYYLLKSAFNVLSMTPYFMEEKPAQGASGRAGIPTSLTSKPGCNSEMQQDHLSAQ